MFRYKFYGFLAACIAACVVTGAHAADQSPAANTHKPSKKMKMDEPMTTGMMKKGMMKGDMKSAADRKAQELNSNMTLEEKSMPKKRTGP